MTTPLSPDFTDQSHEFLVVGLGASAGGIQALQEFFEHVPADSNLAYVVILHLSPNHDSRLAEVLQMVSTIPVTQVREKVVIEPNHVFVVSPDQHLVLENGFIVPVTNLRMEERRAPVDIFFRSLADAYGPRAVSVVLSGTGANGSMGLKRVKEMGGVTYVQNPREAEFNGMPRNAIATELVDEVLPVADMPGRIIAYRDSLGTVDIPVEAGSRPEQQQQALREIFAHLRLRTGHDFSNYKQATLLRRIERRISVRGLPDLPSYAAYLLQHPEESQGLLKDLLISVTNFFRDKKPFAALEQDVLPAIFSHKNAESEVRVWVAGCATGEEAYSLAMLLADRTWGMLDAPKVQIFATDIDEAAIMTAREGLYTLNDAADVSPERLQRYFTKEGDSYRIQRAIREMILFANHNFLKDPPFSRLDLVTCRNVLIYLNATAQERVMETFHFALRPGSYLFLGSAESVDGASDLYATVSRENHLYQARETATHKYPVPESVPALPLRLPLVPLKLTDPASPPPNPNRLSFGELHQKLLEQYAPPSLVVNEDYDILHMSEKAGRYLEFAGGEPTKNLLKLIRPELRLELRSALYQAVQRQTALEARNLPWLWNGERQAVTIHVRPVTKDGDTAKGFVLVLFEPSEQVAGQAGEPVVLLSDEPVARQLEEELIQMKAQLRYSAEQFEYQAEELKASNEELQAINEELRSAAEELETSKEELQSINEELRTVNQELKVKIEEISVTSNNFQNLINSAGVATIFLDRTFRIRLYTPAALQLFNLIPSDHGRPVSDITHRLAYDELLADAETVLAKLTLLEREVSTTDGRAFQMRVLPYRTADDRISGVVVTFFDVTLRKQAEDARRASEQRLQLLTDTMPAFIAFVDPQLRYGFTNQYYQEWFGRTPGELQGRHLREFLGEEAFAEIRPYAEAALAGQRQLFETEIPFQGGSTRYVRSEFVPELRPDGSVAGYYSLVVDITERKQRELSTALLDEIGKELAVLSAPDELMQTVGKRLGEFLALSGCYFVDVDEAKNEVSVHYGWASGQVPSLLQTFQLEDYLSDDFLRTMRTGAAFVLRDTAQDSRAEAKSYALLKVGSFVTVPFFRQGRYIGHIAVTTERAHEWQPQEIQLLQEVSSRVFPRIERARAEEALRQSEEKYRGIFENMDQGFSLHELIVDESGQVTDVLLREVNAAFEHHTGIQNAHGKRISEIVPRLEPVWLEAMTRAYQQGETQRFEAYNADTNRWITSQYSRLGGAGSRLLSTLFTDITERKQQEQRQEFLLKLSDALRPLSDAGAIKGTATRLLGEHLAVNRAFYAEAKEGHWLVTKGYKQAVEPLPDVPFSMADYGQWIINDFYAGRPLLVPDVRTDARFMAPEQAGLAALHIVGSAGVPLVKEGQLVAMLCLHTRAPRAWSTPDMELLQEVAERTWAAVERARAEEALRDLSGQLEQQVQERTAQLQQSTESLQQNLAKLHQAEKAAKMGSWEYDLASDTLSWSAGLYGLFGLPVGSPVRPETYLDYVVEEDRPRAQRLVQQLREQHAPVDETLRLHLGDQVRILLTKSVVMRNEQGEPLKLVGIDLDISEVKHLEEENLHMRLDQQKALLLGILDAQEEERRRIAESLHNGVGQLLYATKLNLERVAKLLPKEATEGTQELLANAIRETRQVSHELVPISLKDFGLADAVQDLCRQYGQASFQTTCEIDGLDNRLESYLEVALYRICQELLTNVAKHAAATRADILLVREEGEITLKVRDDGQGISPDPAQSAGIGLRTIQDRVHLLNGTFAIQANPAGKGTQVTIQLPSAEARPDGEAGAFFG